MTTDDESKEWKKRSRNEWEAVEARLHGLFGLLPSWNAARIGIFAIVVEEQNKGLRDSAGCVLISHFSNAQTKSTFK
ncbi:hypothetical protein L596_017864 [Steinernema carpocapsae]|uniref:Uncharacterized protein n=1 Tax=Steinernema carpocapsae TaxID=34508 RepID=A0A4U5N360_STECR|nr:hypothetical protein L596_017864 [Steinernema carpocapsae]